MTIEGAGQSDTTIDATGVPNNGRGVFWTANDVSVSDLTLLGPPGTSAAFGFKIQPPEPVDGDPITGVSLTNVTVVGSGGSEIDLHKVDGATLTNVIAEGANTAGVGIAITNSTNVVVTNAVAVNNSWGGLAVFTSTVTSPAAADNITIENSTFSGGPVGLYLQDTGHSFVEPGVHGFSNITITGNKFENNVSQIAQIDSNANAQASLDLGLNLDMILTSNTFDRAVVVRNNPIVVPIIFSSIQDGVDAASDGETVQVLAGTYPENVILNKSLTLNGAQAGVDARGRVASESIIAPAAGRGIELRNGSAGSTIDGFEFSGGNRSIESTSGPIDAAQILNNRMLGFTDQGLFLNDNGVDITVDRNFFDAASKTSTGGIVHFDQDNFDGLHFTNNDVQGYGMGTGFFVDGNHNVGQSAARDPLISGNLLDGATLGMNLGRFAFQFGEISENTFSNNTNGLAGGIQNSIIQNNVFQNNGSTGLALTGFGGGTDSTRGAQNTMVLHNEFTGNGFVGNREAIFFAANQFAGTISTNVANNNNIVGNNDGVFYSGDETINVTCNWWGAVDGPSGDGPGTGDTVLGTGFAFTPWLIAEAPDGECFGGMATEIVGPVELRTVDQTQNPDACGDGTGARNCREPVEGAIARAFDRDDDSVGKNPSQVDYPEIWGSGKELAQCTTDVTGHCTLVEPGPGNYLIIVKLGDGDNVIFVGKPKSEDEFEDVEHGWVGPQKEFQVIKLVRRNGDVQYSGGIVQVVKGSYLEILYPEFAVWEDVEEGYVYPFIFTSDSDWEVDVCARMPQGYNIVGVYDENGDLVSDTDCAQTFVADETRVVAFEVEMVGSPEPVLNARLRAKGPGGKVTPLNLDVKGIRIAKEKSGGRVPSEGGSVVPPSGARLPFAPLVAGGLVGALGVVAVSRRLRRRQ